MTIKKEKVEKLFLSDDVVIDVTDEKIYNSGDGVTVNNVENKISADYAAISARLNNLSDPFTLSSQVSSVVAAEALRAKDVEEGLSVAIDSKFYVDGI